MSSQDIRYTAAGILLVIGFMLVVGTFGKYDFNGYISPAEFLGKTGAGLVLMAAAVPVRGVEEMPLYSRANLPAARKEKV